MGLPEAATAAPDRRTEGVVEMMLDATRNYEAPLTRERLFGRQRVHYEAPPAQRLESEIDRFLTWFNGKAESEGLLRAGLAHFWFVTIHPFEDGNGRAARAIADQALAQAETSSQRFYSMSMSSQIQKERADYYDMLERTQKGEMDVTAWLLWFLRCLARAIEDAETAIAGVLQKADFWQRHAQEALGDRVRKSC